MLSEPASLVCEDTGEAVSGKKKLRIALVCSHGGHLTETEALWPAFSEHECFLVTYRCERTERFDLVQRKHLLQNIGANPWRMAKAFVRAILILSRERPDVVLSTGSEIAIPFLWIGKLLGVRTVYVESWCRIRTRSGTGPLVYPAVDLFLVQWPDVLDFYGSKARYEGGLV
jgi:UDP-N-acetylglucosamine:LPS N-acetylglucosamine transferase